MASKLLAKDLLLIALIGPAYFLVSTHLVGIAAAVAFPDWYIPSATENRALSLIVFSLVTTVPAMAFVAFPAGLAIAKLVSNNAVFWAMLIVAISTLYSALDLSLRLEWSFWNSFVRLAIPTHVVEVPDMVAWWLFLPLSTVLFSRWNFAAGGRQK